MEHPTKEELSQMRQQGMTNREIAEALGKNQGTIEYLFRKYKLCRKRSRLTLEQIEEFHRMRQEGMTITEIAEETGYSKDLVYYHIKQKENEEELGPEFPVQFAVPRKPKLEKVVYFGIRYTDMTDIHIPT